MRVQSFHNGIRDLGGAGAEVGGVEAGAEVGGGDNN